MTECAGWAEYVILSFSRDLYQQLKHLKKQNSSTSTLPEEFDGHVSSESSDLTSNCRTLPRRFEPVLHNVYYRDCPNDEDLKISAGEWQLNPSMSF